MRFVFLLLAGLLSLAACENAPWREPPATSQAYAAPVNVDPGESVEVQPGDTVYAVAKRYKVPMQDIIALNQLRSPYILKPGTQVTLPAKQIMTAVRPRKAEPVVVQPVPMQADSAPASIVNEPPVEEGGTTLYHQEATRQQMVDSGQKDVVTYGHSNRQALNSLAEDSAKHPVIVEAPANKPEVISNELALKPLQYDKKKSELKPPVFTKDVAAAHGRFIWPVHGQTVSTFGPKEGGTRNDGINIAAPLGSPVAAADGGTVAYAGSEIPGYGNVVIIRHADGYLTTYAHLERIMVDKDSVAAKGDVIGTVGSSGGLASPQLHFEVRKGAEALDPQKYLLNQ